MSRHALIAALVALAPLPFAFASPPPGVGATAVALDPHDPAVRSVGALDYLGGWVLRGSDRRFGGISSMTIDDGRFLMLSDTGIVTRLRFDGNGQPSDYALMPLPDGPGTSWQKINRDSESSTADPVSGHVWAGFETRNEIWRYTRGFAAADGHAAPPAMQDWPNNEGAEAMVRLRDGRFLVFAEMKRRPDRSHVALLFPGDPVAGATPVSFGITLPPGYNPTDAAQLPDGRVVLLLRRFAAGLGMLGVAPGFAAGIAILDPAAIRADSVVEPKIVATLAPPLTVDNMEALAIEQRDGRTILWIASDDNFLVVQRTLLMAFTLHKGA